MVTFFSSSLRQRGYKLMIPPLPTPAPFTPCRAEKLASCLLEGFEVFFISRGWSTPDSSITRSISLPSFIPIIIERGLQDPGVEITFKDLGNDKGLEKGTAHRAGLKNLRVIPFC